MPELKEFLEASYRESAIFLWFAKIAKDRPESFKLGDFYCATDRLLRDFIRVVRKQTELSTKASRRIMDFYALVTSELCWALYSHKVLPLDPNNVVLVRQRALECMQAVRESVAQRDQLYKQFCGDISSFAINCSQYSPERQLPELPGTLFKHFCENKVVMRDEFNEDQPETGTIKSYVYLKDGDEIEKTLFTLANNQLIAHRKKQNIQMKLGKSELRESIRMAFSLLADEAATLQTGQLIALSRLILLQSEALFNLYRAQGVTNLNDKRNVLLNTLEKLFASEQLRNNTNIFIDLAEFSKLLHHIVVHFSLEDKVANKQHWASKPLAQFGKTIVPQTTETDAWRLIDLCPPDHLRLVKWTEINDNKVLGLLYAALVRKSEQVECAVFRCNSIGCHATLCQFKSQKLIEKRALTRDDARRLGEDIVRRISQPNIPAKDFIANCMLALLVNFSSAKNANMFKNQVSVRTLNYAAKHFSF